MPRKLLHGTRTEQRLASAQRAKAVEMQKAVAVRDYWLAWAGLIGRGWELLFFEYDRAEFIVRTGTARPPLVIDEEMLGALEALAGSRAPKRPRRVYSEASA